MRGNKTNHQDINDLSKTDSSAHAALGFGLFSILLLGAVLAVWSYLNFLCVTNLASGSDATNILLKYFYGNRCNKNTSDIALPSSGYQGKQQLSLVGTTIELSNGGSVDLSFLIGPSAAPGPNGNNGLNGAPGSTGATGPTGATGASGVAAAQNGTVLSAGFLELGTNPLLHNTDIPLNGYNATYSGIGNVVIGSVTPATGAQLTLTDGYDAAGHSAVGNSAAIDGGLLFGTTGDIVLDVEELFSGSLDNYTRGITSFIQGDENVAPSTVASIMSIESEAATSASSIADYDGLLMGVSGQATHNGSGVAAQTRGVSGISALGGAGSIDLAFGVYGANTITGSGNIASSIALYGGPTSITGPGTVTNNYGLFLADQTGIGLNNYNLFSAGSNSFNEFQGNVDVQGHLTTHNHTQSAIDPVSQGTTPAFGAIEPYVVGRYAYIAVCGSGLRIIDLSDPNNPIPVGSIGGLGCSISVQVAGKYAYITGLVTGTLRVIDISNPAAPTLVATLSHPNLSGAQQVRVAGQYAYVAGSTTGSVVVVNISDPTAPTVSAVLTHPNLAGARALTVSGSNLYASGATAARLNVIDITNPTSPTLVGSTPSLPLGGGLGQIASIRVVGRYAYLACLENAGTTPGGSNAFSVVDVSNSSSPTYLTSIFGNPPGPGTTFHNPVGVYDAGRYTYMVSTENGAVGQLTVIDTSNPLAPTQVAQVENADLSAAQALFISGRYAYTTSYGNGLVTIALTGSDLTTASIGNVNSSYMNVFQDFNVSGRAFVGTSLNVGNGGIFSNGALSVSNSANIDGQLSVNNPVVGYAAVVNNANNVGGSAGMKIVAGEDAFTFGADYITFQRPDGTVVGSVNQNSATTVAYNVTSDERLKENIVSATKGLATILAIQVYDYSYKADSNHTLQEGFLAQQLYQQYPQAVTVGSDEVDSSGKLIHPWQVDYSKLTPLLAKGIQDLNAKVDSNTTELLAKLADTQTDVAGLKTYTGYEEQINHGLASDQLTSDFSSINTRLSKLEQASAANYNSQLTENTSSLAKAVFNGGVVTGDVEFRGEAVFLAVSTFKGKTIFEGDIKINGDLAFGKNTGKVKIKNGETSQDVKFDKPYKSIPNVVATPNQLTTSNYAVTKVTNEGFSVEINSPSKNDLDFDWIAVLDN